MSSCPHRSELVDVDICVVSHTNQALVRRCLRSLPQACIDITWRVTVVENLPRTGDPLTEQFPWATVIENVVPAGFGHNHNAILTPIVQQHLARYVLVLNDDTELEDGCVTALVGHADRRSESLGAVGPLLRLPGGERQHSFYSFPTVRGTAIGAVRPGSLTCKPISSGEGWLSGACLLVRAAAAREVGLFDPRFFLFFEDTDLSARLWAANWQLEVCTNATTVHFDHQTVSQPGIRHAMQCQMLRSSYLYFRKHRGAVAATSVTLVCRLTLLLRGLLMAAIGRFNRRPDDRSSGYDLLRLARYDPSIPLAHEAPPSPPSRHEGRGP